MVSMTSASSSIEREVAGEAISVSSADWLALSSVSPQYGHFLSWSYSFFMDFFMPLMKIYSISSQASLPKYSVGKPPRLIVPVSSLLIFSLYIPGLVNFPISSMSTFNYIEKSDFMAGACRLNDNIPAIRATHQYSP